MKFNFFISTPNNRINLADKAIYLNKDLYYPIRTGIIEA